jgi:hypothetical protein
MSTIPTKISRLLHNESCTKINSVYWRLLFKINGQDSSDRRRVCCYWEEGVLVMWLMMWNRTQKNSPSDNSEWTPEENFAVNEHSR